MAVNPWDIVKVAAPIVAGAAGQYFSNRSVGNENERSRQWSTMMYNRQRKDALEDRDFSNAYNDPSAVMQRLQGAGLNPHLVYGHGQPTQPSSTVRGSDAPQAQFNPKKYDIGSVVGNALMFRQLEANIARTEAETQAIQSRTVDQDFKNAVNKAIGVENMRYKYNVEVNRLSQQQKVELSRFQSEITAAGDPHDPNSPAAKAKRAGYDLAFQELRNATTRGDVLASEAAIKRYEKRLTDQGISPNSPYYVKAVLSLLDKVGLGVDTLIGK